MFCSKSLLSVVAGLSLLAALPISVSSQAQQTRGYLQGSSNPFKANTNDNANDNANAYSNTPNDAVVAPFAYDSEHDSDYDSVARDLQAPGLCAPKPIRFNGTQVFTEEKYLVVFLASPEPYGISKVDPLALGDAASLAYADSVDCSLSTGSIRSLRNCSTVVSEIVLGEESLLIKCLKYSSNSVDGSKFIDTQYNRYNLENNGVCDCFCEGADALFFFEDFPSSDGTCGNSCTCTGPRPDCSCPAPYNETLVANWNTFYKSKTDQLGQNVTVVNVTDVQVLENCNANAGFPNANVDFPTFITYNRTSVCLPALVSTDDPTKSPTRNPSKKPTRKPSRKPTRKPSKKPTRKPTKKPTRKPTHSPTGTPTDEPTKVPTKSPTVQPSQSPTPLPMICEQICLLPAYSKLCGFLQQTDLCAALNVPTSTFTLFAPVDPAFAQLGSITDEELTAILKLHVVSGTVGSTFDNLLCDKSSVTLNGQSTKTICNDQVDPDLIVRKIKFQVGEGNVLGQLPLISRQTIPVANGNIFTVSEVIRPAPPTPRPTPRPTPSPAVPEPTTLFYFITDSPTVAPTPVPTVAPTLPPSPVPGAIPAPVPTLPPSPVPTQNPTPPPVTSVVAVPAPTPGDPVGVSTSAPTTLFVFEQLFDPLD